MTATFYVIRRCLAGECEPGCNCHLPIVGVEVDELTDAELLQLAIAGTAAQRAEIVGYLDPVAEFEVAA